MSEVNKRAEDLRWATTGVTTFDEWRIVRKIQTGREEGFMDISKDRSVITNLKPEHVKRRDREDEEHLLH
jgi:hypothetical protein